MYRNNNINRGTSNMNRDRYSETMTAIETTTEKDKQVTRIEIETEKQK